eukprot:692747-Rhodomonas_salina.1
MSGTHLGHAATRYDSTRSTWVVVPGSRLHEVSHAICLCKRYARDVRYWPSARGSFCLCAMRCPVLTSYLWICQCARAMRCAILTHMERVESYIMCYATCGPDTACAALSDARCRHPGFDVEQRGASSFL